MKQKFKNNYYNNYYGISKMLVDARKKQLFIMQWEISQEYNINKIYS